MTYPVKLTLFSLFVSLFVFGWNMFIPVQYTSNHAYFIVIYFFLFSLFTHFVLANSLKDDNKNTFTFRYMAMSGLKLFMSLIVIMIY